MSVGAGIYESYWTDPLTLATKRRSPISASPSSPPRATWGKNAAGQLQYGGITAPGNAPWVLTVGASSTMGTLTRNDDTMASYSSAGRRSSTSARSPTWWRRARGRSRWRCRAAPFYATKAQYLLAGTKKLGTLRI